MPSLAKALVRLLAEVGFRRVYGIIGTSLLGLVDAFYDERDRIDWVTTRHEQVAVSAADAEGRVTGLPGLAAVHAGPGLLNSVISLGIAWKDRSPLLTIVGGVRRRLRGTDAWLEAPLDRVAGPITRAYRVLEEPREIAGALESLIKASLEWPRGPAVLEVPEDLWRAPVDLPPSATRRLAEALRTEPRPGDPGEAASAFIEALEDSRRPLILACGELLGDPAFSQSRLLELAEKTGAYIVTSGNGRSACPEDHPRCLGRAGFGGGSLAADKAIEASDLLLVLGNELDDITTYAYNLLPEGDIIVASMDPSAEKRPVLADTIRARPVLVVEEILSRLTGRRERPEWDAAIRSLRDEWNKLVEDTVRPGTPAYFFRLLDSALPRDRVLAAGQGTHVLYAYDYMRVYEPRSWLAATNLGAMSFALPAGLGAKMARPDRSVVTIAGDGELMMTVQDLETLVRERVPLGVVVVNDNSYRVLYLKQRVQYQGRIYETLLTNPDYRLLAESLGIPYIRADTPENQRRAAQALASPDRPVLVEVPASPDELPPLNLDATLAMNR